jgi:hypothetical protein
MKLLVKVPFKTSMLAATMAIMMSQTLAAAGLTASVSTKTIGLGEAFELSVETQHSDVQGLDLTALKETFNLIGSSQSMRTQIINGQRSAQKSWTLTLTAKSLGELTIPEISAGQYSSNPLSVKVVKAAQLPKAVGASGVSIDVSINEATTNKKFYPFQEIPIKVRIETNQVLKQAELIAPKDADIELTQLGEDNISHIVKNGQRLQVIERDYMLKPQVSGNLSLAPFVLRGKVAKQRAGNTNPQRSDAYIPNHLAMMREFSRSLGSAFADEFSMMGGASKSFQVRTEPLNIDVSQALNASSMNGGISGKQANWFLPAKKLEIKSEWQENPQQMKVGEAIVRKITLTALGVTPEQLPALTFNKVDGAKIYIDSRQTNKAASKQGSVARSETYISIVPTKAGEIELPAIEVPWMNTQTNQSEIAVLPAFKVNVGAVNSNAQTAIKDGPQVKAEGGVHIKESAQASQLFYEKMVAAFNKITTSISLFQGVVVASIVLLLAFLLSYLKRRNVQRRENVAQSNGVSTSLSNKSILTKKNEQECFSALLKALKTNDIKRIYSCLITWSRLKNDPVLKQKLAPQLLLLESALYTLPIEDKEQNNIVNLDVRSLKKQLKILLDEQNQKQVTSTKQLPKLYPH